jgi:hypothetical protein
MANKQINYLKMNLSVYYAFELTAYKIYWIKKDVFSLKV